MKTNKIEDIVIIGAGPSAIFLAYELKTSFKLNPLLLEKNEVFASSWTHMPEFLTLISPWYCNIPKAWEKKFKPNYKMPAKEYAKNLEIFAKSFDLQARFNSEVISINKKEGLFEISLRNGELIIAKAVINASGYFSSPYIPKFKGALETDILTLHYNDYKSAEKSLLNAKDILIVGKRISAGQLLVELCESFNISISSRSEISYGPNEFIWKILYPIYPRLEKLLTFFGISKEPAKVSMFGGLTKSLIQSGRVKVFPNIKEIKKNSVVFENNEEKKFDAIIYTTGYKFNDYMSSNTGGYFTIGKEGLFDYRSRFLRGIKDDAKTVAKNINEYLENAK